MPDRAAVVAPLRVRRRRWTPRDPAAVAAGAQVVTAAILTVAALDFAGGIAIPTVLGVLAAVALAPLARRIEATGVPSWLASAAVVGGLVASAAAAIYALAPSADSWLRRAPEVLREVERTARALARALAPPRGAPAGVAPAPPPGEGATDAVEQLVDGGQQLAADLAISAPGVVGGAVYFGFLTFFLLRDRATVSRWVMRLGGSARTRLAIARSMRDVQGHVSVYLLTISVVNLVVGLLVAAAFHWIGMPNAALWGAAATVLNFMPYIGPAILAATSLAVGLVTFPDPLSAAAPLLAMVAINTVEGYILTPMILSSRMRLSSLSIFVAIAFGAWLWGAAGALIATPTLIVAEAFIARFTPEERRRTSPGPARPAAPPVTGPAAGTLARRAGSA